MATELQLGDISIDVTFKNIKNVHLSVHPPTGRVRLSAPSHMTLETLRLFAISKLGWIKMQQQKMQNQERETPREFLERESHYVWGKRYLLTFVPSHLSPTVSLEHNKMVVRMRPSADEAQKQEVVEAWYREQVRSVVPSLLAKWEPILEVKVSRVFVQKMKTKWGSCNPTSGYIRLNTTLAKKPKECLEYIVVHEMMHLIEPTHNDRFRVLMDRFMPKWPYYRQQLNRLPVSHVAWKY